MQKYHAMKKEMVLRELGADPVTGLSEKEAEKRLQENGANELTKDVKAEIIRLLFTDTHFGNTIRPLEVALTSTSASLVKCFNGTIKKITYPQLK